MNISYFWEANGLSRLQFLNLSQSLLGDYDWEDFFLNPEVLVLGFQHPGDLYEVDPKNII